FLHGVTDQHPAALMAGNSAAHHYETALGVRAHDDEVLRRHPVVAEMAGHLLALEHLAGVLTLTGRTVAAVSDRHTVRCTQTAEIPALRCALETLTDRGAGDVDELARNEMVSRNLSTHLDQVLRGHPELRKLPLRLHLRDREVAAF